MSKKAIHYTFGLRLGVRLCGSLWFDPYAGAYRRSDKYVGRRLSLAGEFFNLLSLRLLPRAHDYGVTMGSNFIPLSFLREYTYTSLFNLVKFNILSISYTDFEPALEQLFSDGRRIRKGVVRSLLRQIRELRRTVERLESYRFYSSSLLIVYEGQFPAIKRRLSKEDSVNSQEEPVLEMEEEEEEEEDSDDEDVFRNGNNTRSISQFNLLSEKYIWNLVHFETMREEMDG